MPTPKLDTRRILWATTFARDMFDASGQHLVSSFLRSNSCGKLLLASEGIKSSLTKPHPGRLVQFDLDDDSWLKFWLRENAAYIPVHLGGTNDGICHCDEGPLDVHDRNHKMPCIGHWFNRNASRWFRKIATQRLALRYADEHEYDMLIWLDSDCRFKRQVLNPDVLKWFRRRAVFYLKNRRPVLEAGILGFDLLHGGGEIIKDVCVRYETGDYRTDKRWDDSAQYQIAIQKSEISSIDIATKVGKNSAVVPHSPLDPWLEHSKGRHGKGLGLMT